MIDRAGARRLGKAGWRGVPGVDGAARALRRGPSGCLPRTPACLVRCPAGVVFLVELPPYDPARGRITFRYRN